MCRRSETADAESLALELFHARHCSRASEYALVVGVLHRADEHDVVALQISDDDVADGYQRRSPPDERLNRYLSAA
jgi:hypothetical protein